MRAGDNRKSERRGFLPSPLFPSLHLLVTQTDLCGEERNMEL